MDICARYQYVVAACLALVVGCSESLESVSPVAPDGRDARAVGDGKADQMMGACQRTHMLLWLNDPSVNADQLIGQGVHHRAARNIAEFRIGNDGQGDGDRYFDSVAEVDEIEFVGPVAFEQMRTAVDHHCGDDDWQRAQVVFSPSSYTSSHIDRIVDAIEGAQRAIDVAIYRLSDHRVINALGDAAARGVRVRMLFDEANGDHLAPQGSTSARLEDRGIDVRYINRTMHHKFAIIDGPQQTLLQASTARVVSGSANMSYVSAVRFDENTIFFRGNPALTLRLQREFNLLWKHSRNIDWNDDIQYVETLPIEEAMIPPGQGLEALMTSDNFETTDSPRWGPGFRPIPFAQTVYRRLVELIEGARQSIDIAARYLRSRPIAQALLRRWREDPDLRIRVYLDQAEYIDLDRHLEQHADRRECLEEAAGDEVASYECRRRGFVYSYALHEQGLPVRFKTYAYRWHIRYAAQMHHKYMIIDDHTVATGSYNYSNNAEQNSMENVFIYRRDFYPNLVDDFVENFESIWHTGGHRQGFETLMEHVDDADSIDLVFEPVALNWSQLTALRERIRERCPQIDQDERWDWPDQQPQCDAS